MLPTSWLHPQVVFRCIHNTGEAQAGRDHRATICLRRLVCCSGCFDIDPYTSASLVLGHNVWDHKEILIVSLMYVYE